MPKMVLLVQNRKTKMKQKKIYMKTMKIMENTGAIFNKI